jgi:hypothetical protein
MSTITDEELAAVPMTREEWDALPVEKMTRQELKEFGDPPIKLITSLHPGPNGYGLARVEIDDEETAR